MAWACSPPPAPRPTLGRQLWAIGVDTDQYRSLPAVDIADALDVPALQSRVLTSMVKRLDTALFTVLEEYSRGIFTPGVRTFDLATGGVEVAYSGGFIDDIRPQIEALRAQIIAGEIDAPQISSDKEEGGVVSQRP